MFGDKIRVEDPLPLTGAHPVLGFSAPFDPVLMRERRDAGMEYQCAVNLLWADPLRSVTPNVPVHSKPVQDRVRSILPTGPQTPETRMHAA